MLLCKVIYILCILTAPLAQHTTTPQSVSCLPPTVKEPALVVNLSQIPDGNLGIRPCTCMQISTHFSFTIDNSHLSVLVTALSTVYQWFPLGIHLGLSHPTLKTIEENQRGQVERCRIDMLDMWLKGPEEKRTKHCLKFALQQLTPTIECMPYVKK